VSHKKAIRTAFRKAVFTRAGYRCECCGVAGHDRQTGGEGAALDAHHIVDRHEFANGGYVLENGIAVCDTCHLKAEAYHMGEVPEAGFWPDELYARIDSSLEAAIVADQNLGARHVG
jgi:hypothetical protein